MKTQDADRLNISLVIVIKDNSISLLLSIMASHLFVEFQVRIHDQRDNI